MRKRQPTWHSWSPFKTWDEKQTNYDEGKLDRRNHNRVYPTFGNVKKSFLTNMAMSQQRLILDVKCIWKSRLTKRCGGTTWIMWAPAEVTAFPELLFGPRCFVGFELVVDILYLCRTEDCCVNQKQLLECKVVVILICVYVCIHTGFDRKWFVWSYYQICALDVKLRSSGTTNLYQTNYGQ